MKLCESGSTLGENMGVTVSKMQESIEAHFQASLKTAQDPDGGPSPADTSGKSWDEASGKRGGWRRAGVHGINRSGGNSLLDRVVFGRVARGACARYVLGDSTKAISLVALAGGGGLEGSKSDSAIIVGGKFVQHCVRVA